MKLNKGKNCIIIDKKSTHIDKTVVIGNNVTIYENNRIEGNSVIGDNVTIYPGCYIIDCNIGESTKIKSSELEKSKVGKNCSIGPYAHLRPNSVLFDDVKVGNFVEIKNAEIGKGTKVSHLAYVGDAKLGSGCNVGCGAIFVNYNGKTKNTTNVGDNCFIGSNCNVIAPVNIKNNSYICAGTTVTDDINSGDFVIGRVKQVVKPDKARLYLKKYIGE